MRRRFEWKCSGKVGDRSREGINRYSQKDPSVISLSSRFTRLLVHKIRTTTFKLSKIIRRRDEDRKTWYTGRHQNFI